MRLSTMPTVSKRSSVDLLGGDFTARSNRRGLGAWTRPARGPSPSRTAYRIETNGSVCTPPPRSRGTRFARATYARDRSGADSDSRGQYLGLAPSSAHSGGRSAPRARRGCRTECIAAKNAERADQAVGQAVARRPARQRSAHFWARERFPSGTSVAGAARISTNLVTAQVAAFQACGRSMTKFLRAPGRLRELLSRFSMSARSSPKAVTNTFDGTGASQHVAPRRMIRHGRATFQQP